MRPYRSIACCTLLCAVLTHPVSAADSLPAVLVPAPTSASAPPAAPPVAGYTVQRGDTLNIQADLVNATDGSQLWGDRYTRKLTDAQAGELARALIAESGLLKAESGLTVLVGLSDVMQLTDAQAGKLARALIKNGDE